MRSVTKKSILGLVEKLGLPAPDNQSQDWEYEVASSDKAGWLLREYVERSDLDEDEKFTLMHIIFESVSDHMKECSEPFYEMKVLEESLMKDFHLHRETMDEWAVWSAESEEEMHAISPFIRNFLKKY